MISRTCKVPGHTGEHCNSCKGGDRLHEVIEEVFVAVLVARLGEIVLSHDIVVGMVSLPCELLALCRDSGLFLSLIESQSCGMTLGVKGGNCRNTAIGAWAWVEGPGKLNYDGEVQDIEGTGRVVLTRAC
jgi:hypothetical protein